MRKIIVILFLIFPVLCFAESAISIGINGDYFLGDILGFKICDSENDLEHELKNKIIVEKESNKLERVFIHDNSIYLKYNEFEFSIGSNINDVRKHLEDIYREEKDGVIEYYFSKKESPFVNDIVKIRYENNVITEIVIHPESDFI
ncbi:MAG: hypothetical protein SOT46_02975 [Treponema sp.]|nr:hypothetical protein [Spirochaetia bacterium]MDY2839316.1 hypothetical protein [Treponema sp.]